MAAPRRDPWELLGLERGADAAAVKAAFRRAALECHPDVNAAPEAAVRFAEVKRAADALLVSSGRFLCWASLLVGFITGPEVWFSPVQNASRSGQHPRWTSSRPRQTYSPWRAAGR